MRGLWRHWWVVALLGVTAAIPLWRPLVLGEAIGPFDRVLPLSQGEVPVTPQAWDVLQADGVLQFWAWRDMVFESWSRGQLPLWNPFSFTGAPLMANSQSGAFYPPHILFGLLNAPTELAMSTLLWLHLMWAGLGTALLARRLGASKPGALLAGGTWAISPFLLAWATLPSVPTTASWWPWVVLGAMWLMSPESSGRRVLATGGLGLSVAMMLLAGHLQFAAYGLVAALVVTLASGPSGWRRGGLGVACGVAMGFVLAAPQLVPVWSLAQEGHRRAVASEEGFAAYQAGALAAFEVPGLVFPKLMGYPGQPLAVEEGSPSLPAYWPLYAKRGANFAEGAMTLGPLVLGSLLLLSRRGWKLSLGVSLVGLLGLLMAFGSPLNRLLYFYVPGWAATGSPGRAGALVVFAGCVLLGMAWAESREDPPSRAAKGAWIAALLCLPVSVVWLVQTTAGLDPWLSGLPDPSALASSQMFAVLPWVVLSAALAGGALWLWSAERPWLGLAFGLAAQLSLAGSALVPTYTEVPERGIPDPNRRTAFVNADWSLFGPARTVMPPNLAAAHRLHEVGGYDSLIDRGTVEMLRRVNGGRDPAPPANGNMMLVKPGFDPQALAQTGATSVVSLDPIEGLQPIGTFGMATEYRLDSPGRVSTSAGPARITEQRYDGLVVEAMGPGTLTLRDRNAPGWRAYIGDEPAPIAPGEWRVIELPPGPHVVHFRYEPPGMRVAAWAAVAVAALWVVAWLWPRTKMLRKPRFAPE